MFLKILGRQLPGCVVEHRFSLKGKGTKASNFLHNPISKIKACPPQAQRLVRP